MPKERLAEVSPFATERIEGVLVGEATVSPDCSC
jgi:hypothetical protein